MFCEQGNMSREHFWAEWLHPLIPQPARQLHQHQQLQQTGVSGRALSRDRFDQRQGSVLNARYRVVCKSCNETWMSGLETDVRPTLSRLICGTEFNLARPAWQTLAHYLLLKIMVVDQAPMSVPTITKAERRSFMASRTWPDGIRIWILATDDDFWKMQVQSDAFTIDWRGDGAQKAANAKLTVWGTGRLVVVSMLDREGQLNLGLDELHAVEVHPGNTGERRWPPLCWTDGLALDDLAHALKVRVRQLHV
jgi:hypothetical protein